MRYSITYLSWQNRGGFASAALAETLGGRVLQTVDDIAVLEFPAEESEYADSLLETDGRVFSYRELPSVADAPEYPVPDRTPCTPGCPVCRLG